MYDAGLLSVLSKVTDTWEWQAVQATMQFKF